MISTTVGWEHEGFVHMVKSVKSVLDNSSDGDGDNDFK